ncbi:MAG TPA: heptosyltransferase, partial [Pasteurellaceae bacterium]|nr:heptosyltransferase [Pasteurellaceae bacterium]
MLIKLLIAKYFGQRCPTKRVDLSRIDSVLLNPLGDAVGDAVAHGLHLRQLKQRYPNVRIGVFVTARNKAVFQASGIVDELIEMKPINYLRQRRKWDLYIDFTTRFNSRTLILDKLLSPQRVMIFGKTPKKYYTLGNIRNYDFYRPVPPNTHFKDYLKHSALGEFLAEQAELFYQLHVPEDLKKQAE